MHLSDLIDRIKQSEKPSAYLDRDVVVALGLRDKAPYWLHSFTRLTSMRLTLSLDAIKHLQRDMVPEMTFTIETSAKGSQVTFSLDDNEVHVSHRLEAHARLMALLHAISMMKAMGAANSMVGKERNLINVRLHAAKNMGGHRT